MKERKYKRSINPTVTQTCPQCGQSFTTYRRYLSRGPQRGRYCSRLCSSVAIQDRINKICPTCGKAFFVTNCHKNIRACSMRCAGILRQTRRIRTCLNCDKDFTIAPSQFTAYKGAGKYCSRDCSYAGIVKTNAIKPIKDKYGRTGRKADQIWKRAVRERDSYTCQRCGKMDRYNHAHHVAMRSLRPDLRHEVSNGQTLCNSCHSWVHRNQTEATKAGFLSSETYEKNRREPKLNSPVS